LLTTAGDQVPGIPFGDVDAKTGAVLPEQIGAIGAKFGVPPAVPHGTVQVLVKEFVPQSPTHVRVKVTSCPAVTPDTM
jgi:hypothetical protein